MSAPSRGRRSPPPASGAARSPSRPPGAPLLTLHASPEIGAGQDRLLRWVTWAAIALAGIALLAMVLGPHRVGDYMTETDFYGQYAAGARGIQQGRLDPSHYGVVGPVYEVALALAGFVVRDLFRAAGLLAAAAAVGTLALWAGLLRRRGDARLALWATLFLATNATFFRYGYSATTDAFALLLQTAALFLLLAGRGPRAALGSGLLAALAFLTRYNAGMLLPAGLLAIAAGGTPQDRRGRAALLFGAGFLLPVVPWVLFSYARGPGVSFQLHHNIAYEVFARARGIPWDTYQSTMQSQFRSLADVIARDPGAVAGRMLFNVLDHLRLEAARFEDYCPNGLQVGKMRIPLGVIGMIYNLDEAVESLKEKMPREEYDHLKNKLSRGKLNAQRFCQFNYGQMQQVFGGLFMAPFEVYKEDIDHDIKGRISKTRKLHIVVFTMCIRVRLDNFPDAGHKSLNQLRWCIISDSQLG